MESNEALQKQVEQWFNDGLVLASQGKFEEAIAVWHQIRREDSSTGYAMAQTNIGIAFNKQGNVDGEIAAYRNVRREDSAEQYAKAQFNLGVTLGRKKEDVDGAIEA